MSRPDVHSCEIHQAVLCHDRQQHLQSAVLLLAKLMSWRKAQEVLRRPTGACPPGSLQSTASSLRRCPGPAAGCGVMVPPLLGRLTAFRTPSMPSQYAVACFCLCALSSLPLSWYFVFCCWQSSVALCMLFVCFCVLLLPLCSFHAFVCFVLRVMLSPTFACFLSCPSAFLLPLCAFCVLVFFLCPLCACSLPCCHHSLAFYAHRFPTANA